MRGQYSRRIAGSKKIFYDDAEIAYSVCEMPRLSLEEIKEETHFHLSMAPRLSLKLLTVLSSPDHSHFPTIVTVAD